MIIVKFQGRLGNQLFQYAFAKSISKQFNTHFLLDNAKNSQFVKYFKIPILIKISNINVKLIHLIKKFVKKKQYQTGDEKFCEIKKSFKNNLYYIGYFQSEDYFDNIRKRIDKEIIIKKKYRKIFNKRYGPLFKEKKILAIHCRFGDYLNWSDDILGTNLTLPESYYLNAISKIDNIDDYLIIVVTDDIPNLRNYFKFTENKLIISENDIMDFQILQNAHKLIISNSSFSWWAGYLNTNSDVIYAPEHWLGFKNNKEWPLGIISKKFTKVNILT
jgi:hypothetical protein